MPVKSGAVAKFLWSQKSSTKKMNFPECNDHSRLRSNFRSALILGSRFLLQNMITIHQDDRPLVGG